jgi:hypothetical protein
MLYLDVDVVVYMTSLGMELKNRLIWYLDVFFVYFFRNDPNIAYCFWTFLSLCM